MNPETAMKFRRSGSGSRIAVAAFAVGFVTPLAAEAQSPADLLSVIEVAVAHAAGVPSLDGRRAVIDRKLPAGLPAATAAERVAGFRTLDASEVIECDDAPPLDRQCWFETAAETDVIVSAISASVDGNTGVVDVVTKVPNEGILRGRPHRWVSEGASRYYLKRVGRVWSVDRVVGLWVS